MLPIAITGGPCAGKTCALEFLERELKERGYTPIIVPECASTFIDAGIAPWTVTLMGFQTAIFELQLAQEEIFGRAAERVEGKVALILDRGLMDGRGYVTDEQFRDLLVSHGIDPDPEKIFARYGAVFHLESTARGLSDAYTLENNEARMENVEEAVAVEDRTLKVWEGHPNRHIIQNEVRFEDKCAHLLNEVLAYLETVEE